MALAGRSRADNEVPGTVIGISGGEGGGGGQNIVVSRNCSRIVNGRQCGLKEQ